MQNNSKNTEMIDLQLIDRYFKKGSQVEISSYDKEFLGSWYNGTVIRVHRKSLTAVVQYESRFDEKYKKRVPLVENVDLAQLRPVQPLEERREFDANEYVDVFYHDGWWEGLVTGFYGERKVNVFFKQFRVLRPVRVSKLRPHCEWVFGKWYPDLDEEPVEPSEDELPLIQARRMVNKVPVKSPKFEVQEGRIKSREIEVPQPSFSKRKTQSREVEVPKPSFSTRKIQSQEVKEPKVYKRKFRSREVDVHSVKTHKSRSRMVEEPSFKKHKVQSREGLFSPSKDVQLRDNMIVPVSSALPLSDGYAPNEEQATCVFKLGQPVELRSNDEGFDGAWLPATVIQTRNANKYLIEYEHILTDDEKSKLIEKVDGKLMRPCPPEVPRFGRFCNLEDVDAFYNDCWWVGAITKVLIHDEYIVYFSNTQETMKFRHSQLRVHQKWINGQWVAPTKMLQF